MTGATPQGRGEQTQPMASPPWLTDTAAGDRPEVAGGWPGGRPDRGPYADLDTVDEPDAWIAGRAGFAPFSQGLGGPPPAGADVGQDPPGADAGSGGAAAAREGRRGPDGRGPAAGFRGAVARLAVG